MIDSLLIVFFAISFRSANLPDKPFDYELTAGLNTGSIETAVLWERESGERHSGYEVKAESKCFRFNAYKRTAKKIGRQKLSYFPFVKKHFSCGVACETRQWREPELQLTALWKNEYLEASYSAGRKRQAATIEAQYRTPLGKHIFLKPLFICRRFNSNFFWQAKVGVELIAGS